MFLLNSDVQPGLRTTYLGSLPTSKTLCSSVLSELGIGPNKSQKEFLQLETHSKNCGILLWRLTKPQHKSACFLLTSSLPSVYKWKLDYTSIIIPKNLPSLAPQKKWQVYLCMMVWNRWARTDRDEPEEKNQGESCPVGSGNRAQSARELRKREKSAGLRKGVVLRYLKKVLSARSTFTFIPTPTCLSWV